MHLQRRTYSKSFKAQVIQECSEPGASIANIALGHSLHHNLGDQNQFIHFLKNTSIAGGMFQVFVFGGGALSLDARLTRKEFQPVRA